MADYAIGIDPGLDGAVAWRFESGVTVYDTPTAVIESGKSKKRCYLPAEMAALIGQFIKGERTTHVFIEKVHAMPSQGVRSMFSMGEGLGLWVGVVAGLGLPYTMVTPQAWKKVMMPGMMRDKDAARVRAQQLFPALADRLARRKDHGRADALLIAEYGRQAS